jgi:hypothetical protein
MSDSIWFLPFSCVSVVRNAQSLPNANMSTLADSSAGAQGHGPAIKRNTPVNVYHGKLRHWTRSIYSQASEAMTTG